MHCRSILSATLLAVVCGAVPSAAQDRTPAFENPPVLKASEILEPALLRSPLHHVSEAVTTAGYRNGYVLNSKYGAQKISGTAMLRVRVQEIHALAEIEKLKSTKEFRQSLTRAAASPLAAAKNLIDKPIDTITGVPRGALRILGRAREGLRGKKKQSEFEDGSLKAILGFSKAKRQLAYRLKVDPYSSNPILQKELNSLAWANFAGDFAVTAALAVASGGAVVAAQGLRTADDLAQTIRDNDPTDLQIANRKKLKAMGIGKEDYEAFLNNPWYSPTTETALVGLLERLGPAAGRDGFLRSAAAAKSEADAIFFLNTIRLVVLYGERVSKVAGITSHRGLPLCYDANRTLVSPRYWDYGSWTEQAAETVRGLQEFPLGDAPASQIHVFMSGQLSGRAGEELKARKVLLTENAFKPVSSTTR